MSAFGALASSHPDLRLVIAGRDGPARPAVDAAIARLPRDAALLFPPGDVDACASALERLLDDDALHADLAERGPARAAEFTWQACAQTHATAYARAIARSAEHD